MARYKVEISGINTNDIAVLSNEEMVELFKKAKEGDKFARDMLVNGNLKLVLSILRQFANKTDNLDDLFQIGCIGLLKAIDNFDLSHDVKFSTYAVPMILGEVRRYMRDNNQIRISRSIKDIAYKALRIKEAYVANHAKEPDTSYIANELGVTETDVITAIEAMKEPVSMFEPIYNDGGDTIYLFDQIEDKRSNDIQLSNRIALEDAINELDSREQKILDERYIIGKTQMEIAEELNISQAQVSRLEKHAIKQLKKTLK